MSDTPRTNKELESYYENDMYFGEESTQDMAEFARKLEREVNRLRKGITDAMDCLDCDSIAYIILTELKENER